jgi:hypothetical protein
VGTEDLMHLYSLLAASAESAKNKLLLRGIKSGRKREGKAREAAETISTGRRRMKKNQQQ